MESMPSGHNGESDPGRSGGRQHPLRVQQDKAHSYGGYRRSRRSGGWSSRRRGSDCRPLEAATAQQYRFPDTPATAAQEKALTKIVVDFLRLKHLHRFQEFGVEALASSIGLERRRTSTLLGEVRTPHRDEEAELAKKVFQAMMAREIAGPLGTRYTDRNQALFRLIATVGEFDVAAEDRDQFRMFSAAFRLDYKLWKERREPWPYKENGAPRKTRSRANGTGRTG
jgi:hypothetical protein